MITINYGEDKALNCKVKVSKAQTFQKQFCKEKSIVELLPEMMAQFDVEFMVNMLHHFQENNPKLSKDEILNILDEVLESESKNISKEQLDLPTLYGLFAKEFDYAGVFKKGMGFMIANQMEKGFAKMVEMDTDKGAEATKLN